MIRLWIFAALVMVSTSVFAGEVIIQAPVVDGVEAEAFGVWVSRRDANQTPEAPWKIPEPVFGPIEIKADEDWIIIVKISTGRPVGLEGAIFKLQELAGLRKEGDE